MESRIEKSASLFFLVSCALFDSPSVSARLTVYLSMAFSLCPFLSLSLSLFHSLSLYLSHSLSLSRSISLTPSLSLTLSCSLSITPPPQGHNQQLQQHTRTIVRQTRREPPFAAPRAPSPHCRPPMADDDDDADQTSNRRYTIWKWLSSHKLSILVNAIF